MNNKQESIGYIRDEDYSFLIFYPSPPPLTHTDTDMRLDDIFKPFIGKKVKIIIEVINE